MSTGINIAPSSGITVGTTAVTSGTDGRVFFQAGGVVQQDANFTFDNTLKRLALKAVGTAGTDIPLSISNSAGTLNLFQVSGNSAYFNGPAATAFTPIFALYRNNSEVFRIDEYKSQFTGNVYMNSIVGPASSGIAFQNQSGSGKLIYMVPTGGTLAIGYGTLTTAAALDVKSQGALSTDIAFRVRNSADTSNIITANGTGEVFIGSGIVGAGQGHLFNMRLGAATASPFAYFDNNVYNFDIARFCNIKLGFGAQNTNSTQSIALGLGSVPSSRNYQQTVAFWTAISQATNDSGFAMSGADTAGNNSIYTNYYGRNIVLGGTTQGTGTRKIVLNNGTVPSTNLTDAFQLYSADITAGNAAPHFRTENGAVVKVYQETTTVVAAAFLANTSAIVDDTATCGGYTMGQVVAALKAQGLLA